MRASSLPKAGAIRAPQTRVLLATSAHVVPPAAFRHFRSCSTVPELSTQGESDSVPKPGNVHARGSTVRSPNQTVEQQVRRR
jgi:hypothetical protein